MNVTPPACPDADPAPDTDSASCPDTESALLYDPCQPLPGPRATLPHDLPIFLVGMMGAGKTTIGRGLARALGREFVDLDHELEARCGVRVPVIFEIEGEEGFRRRESTALERCASRRNIVLATGGGAILAEGNRKLLREQGVVVYLSASVDELFRRTSRDRNRPLLRTADPRATLRDLLQKREPLYREVAHLTVETGCTPVYSLVKSLVPKLQAYEIKQA